MPDANDFKTNNEICPYCHNHGEDGGCITCGLYSTGDVEVDYCKRCFDDGVDGGCPECRIWPPQEPIKIGNVTYKFVTNTTKNSELRKGYSTLDARVLFKEALNIHREPLDNSHVAIWITVQDKKIAARAGLFV